MARWPAGQDRLDGPASVCPVAVPDAGGRVDGRRSGNITDMTTPDEGDQVSFARDIRPLFRAKDIESMQFAFDLSNQADVADHADTILGALQGGQMPCDGAWNSAQVELFQRWIDAGKPA